MSSSGSSDIRALIQETAILIADVGLAYMFYRMYRSRCSKAEQIDKLQIYDLHDLKDTVTTLPNKTLEFAIIEGNVKSTDEPLKSNFGEFVGPIRYFKRSLLKSERIRGYWVNSSTTLSETYDKVPFKLVDSAGLVAVSVIDPRSASFLDEAMHTTHDHFEPDIRSIAGAIWDRIVGHMQKGIQTTERLLKNDTTMMGVGKIVYSSRNGLELRRPDLPDSTYVLTTLTKTELVETMKHKATVFKVMAGIFTVAGVAIFAVTYGSRLRSWYEKYKQRREMAEIRQRLDAMRDNSDQSDAQSNGASASNDCVICLSNVREIALRPCGHVCLCLSCYGGLPMPKTCPVCRNPILDIIPVYIP